MREEKIVRPNTMNEVRAGWMARFFGWLPSNFPDLMTIAVAAYLIVRFTFFPPDWSNPAQVIPRIGELVASLVAVLTLFAISGLLDRQRRLQKIVQLGEENHRLAVVLTELTQENNRLLAVHLSRPPAQAFFRRDETFNDNDFATADSIWVLGMTLNRTVRNIAHIVGQRLAAGAHIRVIMLDPDQDAVLDQLRQRSPNNVSIETWRSKLNASAEHVRSIANNAAAGTTPGRLVTGQAANVGTLEIGYLPYIPAFGLTVIDEGKESASCMVELYHHRTLAHNATFPVRLVNDREWFEFFKQQYNLLWDSCRIETVLEPKEQEVA